MYFTSLSFILFYVPSSLLLFLFTFLLSLAHPTVPSTISYAAIQVNEVKDIVTWEPPPEPNGVIQYYNIRISHDNGTGREELVRMIPEVMETRYDFSTLRLSAGIYVIQASSLFFISCSSTNFSIPSHRSRQSQV